MGGLTSALSSTTTPADGRRPRGKAHVVVEMSGRAPRWAGGGEGEERRRGEEGKRRGDVDTKPEIPSLYTFFGRPCTYVGDINGIINDFLVPIH